MTILHEGLINLIKTCFRMVCCKFLICDVHMQLLWWNIIGNFTPKQNLLLTIELFCDELLVTNSTFQNLRSIFWLALLFSNSNTFLCTVSSTCSRCLLSAHQGADTHCSSISHFSRGNKLQHVASWRTMQCWVKLCEADVLSLRAFPLLFHCQHLASV